MTLFSYFIQQQANIFVHFVPNDHDMMNEELNKAKGLSRPSHTLDTKVEEPVNDKIDVLDLTANSVQATESVGGTCRNAGVGDADKAKSLDHICLSGDGGNNSDGQAVDSREYFLMDA